MNYFLRPYRKLSLDRHCFAVAAGFVAGVILALAPAAAHAQSSNIIQIFEDPFPLLTRSSTPGYLGVYITDVDADKAQALKLKEVRGAVITLIDHDAPAGQIGLKINDVVLALNGQDVNDAEQLRKMLRAIPPGRKVSLEISRDGNIQTLAVQLADRKTVDHDALNKIDDNADDPGPVPSMGIFAGGGDAPTAGGFHLPFFGSTLKVGALVEPLTRKTEAAAAGFRVFDVILKVGPDTINTLADWDRALRSNEGKPVQVTVLRDKKQQLLTLQVDSKHRQSAVEYNSPVVSPQPGSAS